MNTSDKTITQNGFGTLDTSDTLYRILITNCKIRMVREGGLEPP